MQIVCKKKVLRLDYTNELYLRGSSFFLHLFCCCMVEKESFGKDIFSTCEQKFSSCRQIYCESIKNEHLHRIPMCKLVSDIKSGMWRLKRVM